MRPLDVPSLLLRVHYYYDCTHIINFSIVFLYLVTALPFDIILVHTFVPKESIRFTVCDVFYAFLNFFLRSIDCMLLLLRDTLCVYFFMCQEWISRWKGCGCTYFMLSIIKVKKKKVLPASWYNNNVNDWLILDNFYGGEWTTSYCRRQFMTIYWYGFWGLLIIYDSCCSHRIVKQRTIPVILRVFFLMEIWKSFAMKTIKVLKFMNPVDLEETNDKSKDFW